jgi:hypothetical protein
MNISDKPSDQVARPSDDWLAGIFEMIGAGREDFAGIDPDEYVRQLRDGWE